ncbi:MAG: STAS domain-containing protein [Verrucomicrobiota bacterium]
MTKPSPTLFVCVADHTACIKINGRANFTSSVYFKTLVHELRNGGFKEFILDLTECVTMDSTFLGVLAGFVLKQSDGRPPQQALRMQLVNPNPRVLELLENLGVFHLFEICHQAPLAAADYQAPPPEAAPSREEISRTCLEAHQTLMQANPANIPKFKEVTQFLAEDLKKLKGGQG